MGKGDKRPGWITRHRRALLAGLGVVYLGLAVLAVVLFMPEPDPVAKEPFYAGAAVCAECHREQVDQWKGSHHQLAMRKVSEELDRPAFDPPQEIRHGSFVSQARTEDGKFQLVTQAPPDGANRAFEPELAIGVAPLWQYLMPFPGGRWQVTELAYDPVRGDWFDVFEDQDRQHWEWGHWSNRGMNWNAVCAVCHMTDYDKGYQPETDSYQSRWSEMGVSCEACHGPYGQHAQWYRVHDEHERWPGFRPMDVPTQLDMCGGCHSRREELTGNFMPGDAYLDHYRPTLPGASDAYYADGQIRDEDFEFGSFIMSRMHSLSVSCLNCHDAHTGKTRLEAIDNRLCLSCHEGKINPTAHSHHAADSTGNVCVNCHMPQTTYMARHARRDHGFVIPDPLLTKLHGIPNACNKCHTKPEETTEWALEAVEEWYGPAMDRLPRQRALAMAPGKQGREEAIPALLKMATTDPYPAWRAAAMEVLGRWADRPEVQAVLVAGLKHEDALVRAAATRSLTPIASAHPSIEPLLGDPVRLVRIEAAWALRATLDLESEAGKDLMTALRHQADQPPAALQLGQLAYDRGDPATAEGWIRRAAAWESRAAEPRRALAIALQAQGRHGEAIEELRAAVALAPGEAGYLQDLGLAQAEAGRMDEAIATLRRAVETDPRFGRAWYNFGLALSQQGQAAQAIEALRRAELVEPGNADYPYARATIHLRLGEREEARAAAEAALAAQPGFRPALELLARL